MNAAPMWLSPQIGPHFGYLPRRGSDLVNSEAR